MNIKMCRWFHFGQFDLPDDEAVLIRVLVLLDVVAELPTTLAVVPPPPPTEVPPTASRVPPITGEGDDVAGVVALRVPKRHLDAYRSSR